MRWIAPLAGGILLGILFAFTAFAFIEYENSWHPGQPLKKEVSIVKLDDGTFVFDDGANTISSLKITNNEIPDITIHVSSDGEFLIEVALNQKTVVYTGFFRDESKPFDGTVIYTEEGLIWKHISGKIPPLFAKIFVGTVKTDGKSIYFYDGTGKYSDGEPHSTWQLTSEF